MRRDHETRRSYCLPTTAYLYERISSEVAGEVGRMGNEMKKTIEAWVMRNVSRGIFLERSRGFGDGYATADLAEARIFYDEPSQ